jgi:hydroxymethylbilane synthase
VDTRIRRLCEGAYDAIVLAMAGLARLGRAAEVTHPLEAEVLLPAPGQGAICLECRQDDSAVASAAAPLHHGPTAAAVGAERAFLAVLGGGCNVPLGAHAAFLADGSLRLMALIGDPEGATVIRSEGRGSDPSALGRSVAADLESRGASALIGR